MFHLHQSLAYYLYPYPVDMRKSFYTLSGVVSNEMQRDVRGGEVFIFINRQQNIMKILHMEYAGMVIYHKKLDSGRFRLPDYDPVAGSMTIRWSDLLLIVKSVKPRNSKLKNY
jgi:transposase